jgi:hypothetical protein
MVGSTARLGRKTTRDEELEQSRTELPKNLIRPLSYMIAKASRSGDLLSRLPMYAEGWNGVGYDGGASREMEKMAIFGKYPGLKLFKIYECSDLKMFT